VLDEPSFVGDEGLRIDDERPFVADEEPIVLDEPSFVGDEGPRIDDKPRFIFDESRLVA
jgi:hypothetical protein